MKIRIKNLRSRTIIGVNEWDFIVAFQAYVIPAKAGMTYVNLNIKRTMGLIAYPY